MAMHVVGNICEVFEATKSVYTAGVGETGCRQRTRIYHDPPLPEDGIVAQLKSIQSVSNSPDFLSASAAPRSGGGQIVSVRWTICQYLIITV